MTNKPMPVSIYRGRKATDDSQGDNICRNNGAGGSRGQQGAAGRQWRIICNRCRPRSPSVAMHQGLRVQLWTAMQHDKPSMPLNNARHFGLSESLIQMVLRLRLVIHPPSITYRLIRGERYSSQCHSSHQINTALSHKQCQISIT